MKPTSGQSQIWGIQADGSAVWRRDGLRCRSDSIFLCTLAAGFGFLEGFWPEKSSWPKQWKRSSKVEVAQALQDRSVNSTIPMWVRSPSLLQVYGRWGWQLVCSWETNALSKDYPNGWWNISEPGVLKSQFGYRIPMIWVHCRMIVLKTRWAAQILVIFVHPCWLKRRFGTWT